jgi:hypothetical protein
MKRARSLRIINNENQVPVVTIISGMEFIEKRYIALDEADSNLSKETSKKKRQSNIKMEQWTGIKICYSLKS